MQRYSSFSQQMKMLNQERAWIQHQFRELDEAILHGKGSPRILEAARILIPYLLLHFTHREQFRKRIPASLTHQEHLSSKESMTELLQIDEALLKGEIYAALRLRGFCKSWICGSAADLDFPPMDWEQHRSRQDRAQA